MGYRFPDVADGVVFAINAAETAGDAVLWLASMDGGPHHHVYDPGGGTLEGPFRTDRITVDTYAPSRDLAREAAESVAAVLVDRCHDTPTGLLDTVDVEVAPHSMPLQSDTVSMWQAVYRVSTRPV